MLKKKLLFVAPLPLKTKKTKMYITTNFNHCLRQSLNATPLFTKRKHIKDVQSTPKGQTTQFHGSQIKKKTTFMASPHKSFFRNKSKSRHANIPSIKDPHRAPAVTASEREISTWALCWPRVSEGWFVHA